MRYVRLYILMFCAVILSGCNGCTDRTVMSGTEIFKKYNPAVFYIATTDNVQDYFGTGFFVSSKGRAISNYHVFDDMTDVVVVFSDGSTADISRIVAASERYDFVVFDVDVSKKCKFIPLPKTKFKYKPTVGEKVYAIGHPLGLENTFSSGEISQIRRGEDYELQINVPIDHGSSGGPLINRYGEVIGITSGGYGEYSSANLNFAVDIERVRNKIK